MSLLKRIIRNTPLLSSISRKISSLSAKRLEEQNKNRLKNKKTEEVFTEIFEKNSWNGAESISGQGSDLKQTEAVAIALPVLFREYQIKSMIDMPCGDFFWMQHVDLSTIKYLGVDIVKDLIQQNNERFKSDSTSFQSLNMMEDQIPQTDLIFCRDCLVHFSLKDMMQALKNICQSDAKYFCTTTFTKREENKDIITGYWRAINLEIAPFHFPRPLKYIDEKCTLNDQQYTDKMMGLWLMEDLRPIVSKYP